MTPDGTRLLAVNTPDSRLEVFDLTSGTPVSLGAVQVGLDPTSVRALSNDRAWVTNHVSDSISIVDLQNLTVIDTVPTPDEPSDVVFTGSATTGRAWVSCSQPDLVAVYSLANPQNAPTLLPILGEDPRAMAVSPSGDRVYVGIHTSGNNTTVLHGDALGFMQDVIHTPGAPWGGAFAQVPNSAAGYTPAYNPNNVGFPPPETGLIVRKDAAGRWLDDYSGPGGPQDWTQIVTGGQFDRVANWDLYDHDLAVIDTTANPPTVTYAKTAMNIVMSIAIHPDASSYGISMVGTEATNEIRFEPNLKGTFVRAVAAEVDLANNVIGPIDLNIGHLNYSTSQIPQAQRDRSVGDPRAHVWHSTGDAGYVAGMGSNNVVAIDRGGNRILEIEVGSGPTGLALDEPRLQLYVLNKFGSSISVVDSTFTAVQEIPFHDPTPVAVKLGRKHLYDTHRTSGLGQVSCASCHVNSRDDGLAWDLGNPAADIRVAHTPNFNRLPGQSLGQPKDSLYHPMKGPMVTQTLQDIIGHEPLHWRGDRKSIQEFNGAFEELQGDDAFLTGAEMLEFRDFLASIAVPPNPHRQKTDNGLQTNMDLTKWSFFYHDANNTATSITSGNAVIGEAIYNVVCAACHTPDVGIGPDRVWNGAMWSASTAPGGHGERFSGLSGPEGPSQAPLKVAPLRNMHEKTGFNALVQMNTRGSGYVHDGNVDTLARFISQFRQQFQNLNLNPMTATADVTAYVMSFAATDMYTGSASSLFTPPAVPGQNSHAATGRQWTVRSSTLTNQDLVELGEIFAARDAAPNRIEIVAKQNLAAGGQRGLLYASGGNWVDDAGNFLNSNQLLASVGAGTEVTLTLVPATTAFRSAIDRDGDGSLDADEAMLGTNPASSRSVPPAAGTPCNQAVPTAPGTMTAAASGPYLVNIGWMDNSSNETGFAIERRWTNSPQWEPVADVAANTTVYADGSVGVNTGYIYRVRAYNCAGESTAAVSNATTTAPPPGTELCHVHAIDLQIENQGNPVTMKRAYGTVNVVNEQGRIIKGAQVTVQITGPSSVGTFTSTTNDQGQALFLTGFVPPGSVGNGWTFTVTNIFSGTQAVVYDPARNFVVSNSIQ